MMTHPHGGPTTKRWPQGCATPQSTIDLAVFKSTAAHQAAGAPSGPHIAESPSASPPRKSATVVMGTKGMFNKIPIGETR